VKLMLGLITSAVTLVLGAAIVMGGGPSGSTPSPSALKEIPPDLLPVYVGAATTCGGLPWQVLAAIGYHESRHAAGRADPATGEVEPPIFGPPLDGRNGNARIPDASFSDGWAHAMGPMQFIPSTWLRWRTLAPNRPPGAAPSPQNAWDEIYSAAAYLCGGRPALENLERAILSYDHSEEYMRWVLRKAGEYGMAAQIAVTPVVDGVTCPVAGPVQFDDDFGDPRSGGREHHGNDLFAAYGTPIVAIEGGVVFQANSTPVGLGGIDIWLRGDSGTTYYHAHDSANVVVVNQRVSAGQFVAYVGDTGNARGGPAHLHFEIHPGGGAAVDPYETVSRVCAPNRD
jgi:Peptidase family M23